MGKVVAPTSRGRRNSKPDHNLLQTQIDQALKIVRTGRLLTLAQLPGPWRINPFLIHGYTFAGSVPSCIHNSLRLSNESFNIWSHILGLASILYLGIYHYTTTLIYHEGTRSDTVVMGLYLSAAGLCLSCSIFWHTMKCHCDPHFMISCASVDLSGVTIMISATNIVMQYSSFPCSPTTCAIYIASTVACGMASLVLAWSPKFRHPDLALLRVIVFTLLGIVGLLPMPHVWVTEGKERVWALYTPVWVEVVAPIFSGAWVYAGKIPERWFPGVFDFCGHSHNVWHIAVLATIWGGYKVALLSLETTTGHCRS